MITGDYIVKKLYCIFDDRICISSYPLQEYSLGFIVEPTPDCNNIESITLLYMEQTHTITKKNMPKLDCFLSDINSGMYLSNMCEDLFTSISNTDIDTKKTIYSDFIIDKSITLVDFFISGLCSFICLMYLFELNLIFDAPITNLPLDIHNRKYLTKNYTSLISLYINYLCYVVPQHINFYLYIDIFIDMWCKYMIEGDLLENSVINKVSIDILMLFIKKSTVAENKNHDTFLSMINDIKNNILTLNNKTNSLSKYTDELKKSSTNFIYDISTKIDNLTAKLNNLERHTDCLEENLLKYYHSMQSEFFVFCKKIKETLNI